MSRPAIGWSIRILSAACTAATLPSRSHSDSILRIVPFTLSNATSPNSSIKCDLNRRYVGGFSFVNGVSIFVASLTTTSASASTVAATAGAAASLFISITSKSSDTGSSTRFDASTFTFSSFFASRAFCFASASAAFFSAASASRRAFSSAALIFATLTCAATFSARLCFHSLPSAVSSQYFAVSTSLKSCSHSKLVRCCWYVQLEVPPKMATLGRNVVSVLRRPISCSSAARSYEPSVKTSSASVAARDASDPGSCMTVLYTKSTKPAWYI